MKQFKTRMLAAAVCMFAAASPVTAGADPDTDFGNALHTVGIYGPKDYTAWIGKIACERLDRGVDHTAFDSATFAGRQLTGYSTDQVWRFVDLAYGTYCPEHSPLLAQAANKPA